MCRHECRKEYMEECREKCWEKCRDDECRSVGRSEWMSVGGALG